MIWFCVYAAYNDRFLKRETRKKKKGKEKKKKKNSPNERKEKMNFGGEPGEAGGSGGDKRDQKNAAEQIDRAAIPLSAEGLVSAFMHPSFLPLLHQLRELRDENNLLNQISKKVNELGGGEDAGLNRFVTFPFVISHVWNSIFLNHSLPKILCFYLQQAKRRARAYQEAKRWAVQKLG